MEIVKQPNKSNCGIAVYKNKVYHFVFGVWYPCGDCKITDKYIKRLIKLHRSRKRGAK